MIFSCGIAQLHELFVLSASGYQWNVDHPNKAGRKWADLK
jgi:hypothetical protein